MANAQTVHDRKKNLHRSFLDLWFALLGCCLCFPTLLFPSPRFSSVFLPLPLPSPTPSRRTAPAPLPPPSTPSLPLSPSPSPDVPAGPQHRRLSAARAGPPMAPPGCGAPRHSPSGPRRWPPARVPPTRLAHADSRLLLLCLTKP